jgi:Cu/Ag efflux pump CusA
MRWIVGSSLKLRRLVVALAAGIVALGVLQTDQTPVDSLPEFQPPTVEVQTEALGLSAAEVEQLITVPLEQDLLIGVPFLDEIESVSLPGLSSVVMTFEPGTDVLDARQVVQERLTQAVGVAGLPAVAKPPQMIQPLSSSSRVSMLKLTSDKLTPIEMSVLARWVIGPRLLGVTGVANVAIWGNRERQLQVLVDPDRLRENGVTLSEVVRTAGNALEVSPLSYLEASKPGTGGFIDTPNQRLNIFHEQAISTPQDLAQVPVEGPDGATLRGTGGNLSLGDVADVVENHQPLIGDTACKGGEDCLLLVVEKFPNANTAQVSDDVDAALQALAPGLADMQIDSSVYRPGSYIEATWENLEVALIAGAVLLLLVLLGLFWDWRRTLVIAAGVAVSMATAVLVLGALDTTVNLLVMAGLVLGVTAMVDDAVNDSVGLSRRIRRHGETGTSAPVWSAVVDGAVRLRRYALYGALMVAAATLPLFFLQGEGAAFLPPIALAYLLAVSASFLVTLTVTPALAMMLFKSTHQRESALVRLVHRRYDTAGPRLVARPGGALAVIAVIGVLGLASLPFLDVSLQPHLKEREVLVHLQTAPGTSLPKMTGLTARAVDDLAQLPGVSNVNAHVGRAIMSDQRVDVNEAEVWMSIDPSADYDATVASVEDQVRGYDEVAAEVKTYTDARVSQVLAADESDVAVRVYGEDPEVLASKAEELRSAISGVDGVSATRIKPTPEESTVEVEVDLERARALGVKPGDVRRAAAILLGSITVGNLFEEQKVFDVVVWGAPQVRASLSDVARLRIDTPDGRTVRLGDVADVREVPNAAVIKHESVARYVELTANVSGRSVADVNEDVKALVSSIDFPLDHHAEVLGGYAEREAALWRVGGLVAAAFVLVFLLFQAAFRSWRLAALAVALLPVASAGALLATLATDGTVTLGVITGALAVLGTSSRAILLSVGHLLHLERREQIEFGPDLVVRGTRDRLVPMLGTVLASTALLLPIALAGGATGFEILRPAVLAYLGGLVTTTVVALFVLPAVHLRIGSVSDADNWVDDLYEPAPDLDAVRT